MHLHPNRPSAIYCRFCGVQLSSEGKPQKIIENSVNLQFVSGTKTNSMYMLQPEIQSRLKTFIVTQKIRCRQRGIGLNIAFVTPIFLFYGETGTGKTFIARSFIEDLKNSRCLSSNKVIVTTLHKMQEICRSETDVANYLSEQAPDVLFIDEIQQDISYLYTLLAGLSEKNTPAIIILAGIKKIVEEFLKEHPELTDLVELFEFKPLSNEDLCFILNQKLTSAGLVYTDIEHSLLECVSVVRNDKNCIYKNGWIVEKEILRKILEKQAVRLSNLSNASENDFRTVVQSDLPVSVSRISTDEILSQLDELIGMDSVKNQIRQLCNTISNNQKRLELGLIAENPKIHIILTGNPGTGKTTVSRLLSKLFKAMKLLPSDNFVEVDGLGITASYVGQTKDKVNELCEKASGGVLFIDEAYYLEESGGEYSKEAVGALLKRMEDDRGKFIVIAAGYKTEMERFLKMNPGLESRFGIKINIEDYSSDELCRIFELYVKKAGFFVEDNAMLDVVKTIDSLCKNKNKDFANAREIRNLFDKIKMNMDTRLSSVEPEFLTKEVLSTICKDDIPQTENKQCSVEEVFAELNGLVGMDNVKRAIKEIYDTAKINLEFEKKGLQSKKQELHFALTGNPGTGKTTVARLLGKLFYSMGLLTSDKVIETDRSKLVARFVGHTAKNVQTFCDDAYGGILFIDEVYTLAKDDFGKEATDTLMKRMEDDRGKFIVVVAGYEDKMQEWMHSNQGLSSRFTHHLHIEDYDTNELLEIFMLYIKQGNLRLSEDAVTVLEQGITKISLNRGVDFANGRTVRHFFDSVVRRKNSRIIKLSESERTKEALVTLTAEDFMEGSL